MSTDGFVFQPRKPIQYRPRPAATSPQATPAPAPATPATPASPATPTAPPALKLAGTHAEPKKPAAGGRQ